MSGALFTKNQIVDNLYSLEYCARYAIERAREGKMSYIMLDNDDDYEELVQLICNGRKLSKEELDRINIAYIVPI